MLSRPSLGDEHSLPDMDIIPLTCSPLPPAWRTIPPGTHQVKRDLDGHSGRVIGSDNTRFFLRMWLPVDWCLEDPRNEIGAFFTGTVQRTYVMNHFFNSGRNANLGIEYGLFWWQSSHDVLYLETTRFNNDGFEHDKIPWYGG